MSLRSAALGFVLESATCAQAQAAGVVVSAGSVGGDLLIQLIYLPAGLLVATLILEAIALGRRAKDFQVGVLALLGCTFASACIALALSKLAVGRAGSIPASIFSSSGIGITFTALMLLACLAKFLSLRAPRSGINGGERTATRKGTRGRGRRRHAAKNVVVPGKLIRAGADSVYALSLATAMAALAFAPLFSDGPRSDPLVAPAAGPIEGDDPTEPASLGEAAGDSIPEPPAIPPTSTVAEMTNEDGNDAPGSPEPPITSLGPETDTTSEAEGDPEMLSVDTASNVAKLEPERDLDPTELPDEEAAQDAPSDTEAVPATVAARPQPAVKPVFAQQGGLAGAETYKQLVQPILRSRCYDCHGEDKQKGDLRLDTPEGIRLGGKSGAAITAGKPEESYLFELISLDESDDGIMPPKGKPLSAAQISWIGGWIREGAALGDGVAWPVPEGGGDGGDGALDHLAEGIATADGNTVQSLLDGGVIVRQLSSDGNLLEIDYSHADRAAGDLRLEELRPIAANIHTLDLKRTKITDADLEALSAMENLRILHLQRTKIGDAALVHLSGLEQLESLNLYSTQVSDAGLPELKKLSSLKQIYLWSSQVTGEGARELAGVLGADVVNMGE